MLDASLYLLLNFSTDHTPCDVVEFKDARRETRSECTGVMTGVLSKYSPCPCKKSAQCDFQI